jgi:hypothetical protein
MRMRLPRRGAGLIFTVGLGVIVGAQTPPAPQGRRTAPSADATDQNARVPPDRSFSVKAYLEAGMPPPDRPWGAAQFASAAAALREIARDGETLLPRAGSRTSGQVWARIISPDNWTAYGDPTRAALQRFAEWLQAFQQFQAFTGLYSARSGPPGAFDVEKVDLLLAFLRASIVGMRVAEEARPTVPADLPQRAEFMQMADQILNLAPSIVDASLQGLLNTDMFSLAQRVRLARELEKPVAELLPLVPAATRTAIATRLLTISNYRLPVSVQAAMAPLFIAASAASRVEPPPAGTARLSGQVVARDTGAPVGKARLMLTGVPGRPPQTGTQSFPSVMRTAETDEGGLFEFAGLPAGSYLVNAWPESGFVTRGSADAAGRLADGESATATIRLDPAFAIAGRVRTKSGRPVAGAVVRALRYQTSGGVPRLVETTRTVTNDRGEYRLADVPFGDCYVNASGAGVSGPPSGNPKASFAPTFHPSSVAMKGAQAVAATKSRREVIKVDVTVQPAAMCRVIVSAVDSAGKTLPRAATLSLRPASGELAFLEARTTGRTDGARFVFDDVPPGDYYVSAGMPTPVEGIGEGGYVAVAVKGDTRTLTLRTNKGAVISGRVVREGYTRGAPRPPGPPPIPMVAVRPADAFTAATAWGQSRLFARVADDWSFQLTGLRGTFMLDAGQARRAMVRGVQSATTTPIEVSGTEQIVAVLESGGPAVRLSGEVTDAGGAPVAGAWVFLIPEDPTLSVVASPLIRTTRSAVPKWSPVILVSEGVPMDWTGTPGTFEYVVPSGRYLVAALPGSDWMPPLDRAMIERLRRDATPVEAGSPQTRNIQVRIAR